MGLRSANYICVIAAGLINTSLVNVIAIETFQTPFRACICAGLIKRTGCSGSEEAVQANQNGLKCDYQHVNPVI